MPKASISAASERLALLEPAGVHRERAAAALRRRDDLESLGGEDARRGGVHVREDRALDAAREQADARAPRSGRRRHRGNSPRPRQRGAISTSGRNRLGIGTARPSGASRSAARMRPG